MIGLRVKKQPIKFLTSVKHALDGVWHVIQQERNARIHLVIACLVIILAILLRLDILHWLLLLVAIGLVFTAEMLNTVVEILVDLTVQEVHPMAKTAKDVAAGAVLLMAVVAAVIGIFVFGPPLLALFSKLVNS
ncbi:MAG: diacylglycerol kinase family protein [Anaerolineae bacterium]